MQAQHILANIKETIDIKIPDMTPDKDPLTDIAQKKARGIPVNSKKPSQNPPVSEPPK